MTKCSSWTAGSHCEGHTGTWRITDIQYQTVQTKRNVCTSSTDRGKYKMRPYSNTKTEPFMGMASGVHSEWTDTHMKGQPQY